MTSIMNGSTFTMREPCAACGNTVGRLTETGAQDVVRCFGCDRFQYNAPRVETGKRKRSLSTREGVTPSQRARVLALHGNACIYCGKHPPEVRLELEHMISRELAERHGLLDDLIDSVHNLAPACPECNSGRRHVPFNASTVALMLRALTLAAKAAVDL